MPSFVGKCIKNETSYTAMPNASIKPATLRFLFEPDILSSCFCSDSMKLNTNDE